jgi:hypothetical protein
MRVPRCSHALLPRRRNKKGLERLLVDVAVAFQNQDRESDAHVFVVAVI